LEQYVHCVYVKPLLYPLFLRERAGVRVESMMASFLYSLSLRERAGVRVVNPEALTA
jgi:hypothetical protein